MKCERVDYKSVYEKGDVVLHFSETMRGNLSLICGNVDVYIISGKIKVTQYTAGYFYRVDEIYRKVK